MTPGSPADADRFAQDRWEEEGRRIGPSLDRVAGVVVVGEDAAAAASVALGIGRVQAARRRVAIADLVGEVAPLQSLVRGDDPHGIVDSFLYGVSLNKIARPIDDTGNLFVLPSGSEPIVADEIFRSERWGKLASGFRDVGALLLLVAPAGAAGLETLARRVDGVVLAGRATSAPGGADVIAVAEPPSLEVPGVEETTEELPVRVAPAAIADPALVTADAAVPPPAAEPAPFAGDVAVPDETAVGADRVDSADLAHDAAESHADEASSAPAEPLERARPATRWVRRVAEAPPTLVNMQTVSSDRAPEDEGLSSDDDFVITRPRRWPYALAAGLVVAAAGLALFTRGGSTTSDAARRDTAAPAVAVRDSTTAPTGDSAGASTAAGVTGGATTAAGEVAATSATPAGAGAPAASAPQLTVANPADSSSAAAFSVQIVAANTMDGARAKLRDVALGLPAAVISPMSLGADSTRWYRLTVGAFADRQAAIAYLSQLRASRKLDLEAENVVRLPYALLLAGRVPRSTAKATAADYVSRGLPAYALAQSDGTARVYAGAFETPEQAGLLADLLRTAGIDPVVAYRTGRGF